MTETETERLFLALWPDAAARAALVAAAGAFTGGGRPVPPERVHMTLVFLGEVQAGGRSCIEQGCGGIAVPPFQMLIDRLGWWRRSGVFWAGPREVPTELVRLVGALRAAVSRCGVPVEQRRFAAHATLARKARHAADHDLPRPIPWEVNEFALVRSVLGGRGVDYLTVARWPLRPPRGGG